MRFLIFICCFIKLVNGITLNCTFDFQDTVYHEVYSCIAKHVHTSFLDRTVTDIIGVHKNGKSNDDVKQVFIKHQNVPYLPLNLGAFFSNLETLYVMKSNVQHLMNGDLDDLTNLKIFDVSHNPVEQIGENFFKGCKNIQKISFYDCHIKKVNRGALDPLVNLHTLFFDQNPCTDLRYESDYGNREYQIEAVIADIYDKCHGMEHSLRTNETELCHNIKIVNENSDAEKLSAVAGEFVEEKSTSEWTVVLTVLLTLTILLNIIFTVLLVRIVRNNFNGNWHEMKNVLI